MRKVAGAYVVQRLQKGDIASAAPMLAAAAEARAALPAASLPAPALRLLRIEGGSSLWPHP